MKLLKVDALTKVFEDKGLLGGGTSVRAVDRVSFSIEERGVTALVGESGCGKSTVARLVLRLVEPTSGRVFFRDQDIFGLDRNALKSFRRSVQIIFQDPFASLNPRRTVYDTVSEPLLIHKIGPKAAMRDSVVDILGKVGLGPDVLPRYPHEFSGGQRQRICIARALAVSPELIVADEPLSALDVSIQAQILNLLQDLRRRLQIAFLFISHDLRVVRYFSDTVAVMYLGRIVEYAETETLFAGPLHPYTELLFSSAPRIPGGETDGHPAPIHTKGDSIDAGDVPSPLNVPSGCPFHPRCPKRFEPCDRIVPLLKEYENRSVACHLWHSV